MGPPVDYDALDAALNRCGSSWDAAQTHGLLSGRLAIAGADSGFEWLGQVLEGTDPNNVLRGECEALLSQLFEATYRQLSERQSGFEPLFFARIDDKTNLPWYYSVAPYEFEIHDIVEQRGGVSILDNVINPRLGEKTELHYVLGEAGSVTITVFNLAGDRINTLVREQQAAGDYSIAWDGTNEAARYVASGLYIYRIQAGEFNAVRKVTLLR